ncbi:glycosyltransferase [Chroococcidiopsis sp. FACHB-1243]|uniref:glycosyltransferase family 2 protein n=1 Tax=Chroococcidiopsis sp. [FACHB-1243] TaxID=2692781 RepID=UPI00178438A3|nr:glycosyltransferase [Chroococcidiopsis sp. [FACHB-1243]]MBD2305752.1 glycosyltransferase [Chroococcidiopsis sp. [FACHB-1243]]
MTNPQVTIVVAPRERFSYARQSLESIYANTCIPFELIYVDGNSPTEVQRYLEAVAQEKGFQLIRTSYYLFPNRARNLGLARVNTKYVAFIDNDVIVSPGWLEALIQCAEETGATVVGPLMCHEEPVHEVVHCAGGEARVVCDSTGRRRLREKMYKQGHQVVEVRPKMQRTQTELCEFHCMLVRAQIFEQLGFFDELMLNSKEHLDFCMSVIQAGGTVYFEPSSIITYVPGQPLKPTDLHFYMLRWSDAWELASLSRLREKWQLAEDSYFQHKYKSLGWRRRNTILLPLIDRLTLGIKNQSLEKILMYGLFAPLETLLNRYLTASYARKHLKQKNTQAAPALEEPIATATPRC